MHSSTPVLELRGVTKAFPGVLANDHIDLTLHAREVHALLGENGAGKSTLMNILYGLYHPDAGEILVRGQATQLSGPKDAIDLGIGMVHQHFMLIPVLSVTENVMLGVEPVTNGVFLDRKAVADRIRQIAAQYHLNVDPNALIKDLPVGLQQRVEIIKLLYRSADIIILDEPTAVLTPQEAGELFTIIQGLRADGKSVIFITHKLNEVMAIADRITVLRAGKVVGSTVPSQTDSSQLAAMMVGRSVMLQVEKTPAYPTGEVLRLDHLYVRDDLGGLAVEDVSLTVHEGEIVGVAGVQGNGQMELVQAVTGLRAVESGQVLIKGQDVTRATPRQILEAGVAHVPEDRQQDGLVLTFPIRDNMVLNTYYQPPFAIGSLLNEDIILRTAQERAAEFDVRAPSVEVNVGVLSGGNQQKVIVAREFSRPIDLLVASQPTRGIDVGSIEYIHRRIVAKRDDGCAVLLISSELDEVLNLADRIAVMFEGRIVALLDAREATREQIGLLMAGSQAAASLSQNDAL